MGEITNQMIWDTLEAIKREGCQTRVVFHVDQQSSIPGSRTMCAKRISLALVLAVSICATAQSANAGESKKSIAFSPGTCGKWLAAASSEPDARVFMGSWILGWLSAAGYYDVYGGLEETDSDGVVAFTNRYCADHPLESVGHAAAALVKALAKPKG